MNILITGSKGFIGSNLKLFLIERGHTVLEYYKGSSLDSLSSNIENADQIVHLAGVNRSISDEDFIESNIELSKKLLELVLKNKRKIPIIFSSTIHSGRKDIYGQTKKVANNLFEKFASENQSPLTILNLPNVFGKWCRPNYNSVIATFCHKIARNEEIEIHDAKAEIKCVYIDDVLNLIYETILAPPEGFLSKEIKTYEIEVGKLAKILYGFYELRDSHEICSLTGLNKYLYSTYLSNIPTSDFSYSLNKNTDERGFFSEILRTEESGQFSVFTALPGITRGGHYHHTKTEKFLVIKGKALFNFKNMNTEETYQLEVDDRNLLIVDTVPGWAHDIKNIGESELVVFLWANEKFDDKRPDTYVAETK